MRKRIIVDNWKELAQLTQKIIEVYAEQCPNTFKSNKGDFKIALGLEELVGSKEISNEERTFFVERFDFLTNKKWEVDPIEGDFYDTAGEKYYFEENETEPFEFLSDYEISNKELGFDEGQDSNLNINLLGYWHPEFKTLWNEVNQEIPESTTVIQLNKEDEIRVSIFKDKQELKIQMEIKPQKIIQLQSNFDEKFNNKVIGMTKKLSRRLALEKTFGKI